MDPYRKLLVLGLNHLIAEDLIDLSSDEDVEGHAEAMIADKPAMVLWSGVGFGELRVSVWWDYDHSKHPQADLQGNSRERFQTSTPLAKQSHYPKFVGVVVSGWLERRTGKYLQGRGGEHMFDQYCRRGMSAALKAIPDPVPNGYAAEGRFHL